jgi:hypothetical protein
MALARSGGCDRQLFVYKTVAGQGHDVSGWCGKVGGGLNKTQDWLEELRGRCSEWRSGSLAPRSLARVSAV